MNRLEMATVQAIMSLWSRGWSIRRNARELGIDRETVSRYLRPSRGAGSDPKPANAPLGAEDRRSSEGEDIGAGRRSESEVARGRASQSELLRGRASDCEPLRDIILAKLDADLSAQRIYQDLMSEHGFAGSYYSVRRFVRRLGSERPLPCRRLERRPGEEAQVDFGTGACVLRDALDDDDLEPAAGGLGQAHRRRPSATAILDRFLHHADILTITGKSYRLRNQAKPSEEPPDAQTSPKAGQQERKSLNGKKDRRPERSKGRSAATDSDAAQA